MSLQVKVMHFVELIQNSLTMLDLFKLLLSFKLFYLKICDLVMGLFIT